MAYRRRYECILLYSWHSRVLHARDEWMWCYNEIILHTKPIVQILLWIIYISITRLDEFITNLTNELEGLHDAVKLRAVLVWYLERSLGVWFTPEITSLGKSPHCGTKVMKWLECKTRMYQWVWVEQAVEYHQPCWPSWYSTAYCPHPCDPYPHITPLRWSRHIFI